MDRVLAHKAEHPSAVSQQHDVPLSKAPESVQASSSGNSGEANHVSHPEQSASEGSTRQQVEF